MTWRKVARPRRARPGMLTYARLLGRRLFSGGRGGAGDGVSSVIAVRSSPVAAVLFVTRYPIEGRDRRPERNLAGQRDTGDDLRQLLDLVPADTPHQLEALVLGR